MTIERTIAQLFNLDDVTWLRHANPWSVILRFTVLPILIIAFSEPLDRAQKFIR